MPDSFYFKARSQEGWMKIRLLAAAAALCSIPGWAQTARDPAEKNCGPAATELMILGSYHMDNPGLDAVNVEADDVLTPRRQAEIKRLNVALLKFRPTKVAVEGDRSSTTFQKRYRDWIGGRYTLGRNEAEQIGMKVARAAGHETIYSIDFPMFMSGLRYDEVEFRPAKASAATPAPPRQLTDEEKRLRRLSVIENLRLMNDPARSAESHAGYMDLLEPDPNDVVLYGRADSLTNWYKRNIRMMANVARISGPGDRVLLVVGSGHLAIMRDFAVASPAFCLADTLFYLGSGR
jgi:hypothetical protein